VQGNGKHFKEVLAVKQDKDYWADASGSSENPTSFPCNFWHLCGKSSQFNPGSYSPALELGGKWLQNEVNRSGNPL